MVDKFLPAVEFRNELLTELVEPMLKYFYENFDIKTACLLALDLNEEHLAVLKAFPENENINYSSKPVNGTIFQGILKNSKNVQLSERSLDLTTMPYYLKEENIKSLATQPIIISNRTLALLCVDCPHSEGFAGDLLELMNIMAKIMAYLLVRNLELNEGGK